MNKQQKWLNISICYILLYATMNTTMMNVALPSIAKDFVLTPSEVSWVTAIFSLFFGIGSVTFGKLADMFPVRRLLLIGLGIFMVGSLVGFFNVNYGMVVAARIVQGFGAGALPSLSLVAAARFYPAENRGRVLAMVFSIVALGAAIGPILGGFLTDWFGWKTLFLMSLLSLLGVPHFLKYAPKEETKTGHFDMGGAILLMLAVTSILMGINVSAWLLLFAVVFLVLFFLQNQRAAEPFIEINILKNSPFRLVLLMSFLNSITYMGVLFIIPLMLTKANALSSDWIGLVLFPGALLTAVLGPLVGKLIDKHGSLHINQWSFIIMVFACVGLSIFVGSSPIWISILLIVIFLGFTANQTAFSNHISVIVPSSENGIAMGLFTLMTFLASAIGIALFSRFLEFNSGHWNPLNISDYSAYSNALLLTAVVILLAMGVLAWEKRITKENEGVVTASNEEVN
ncbi:MFS transporter [Oceanobacillus neutriphilus]|uniref:MFS transporter n=1 Tax=Oceanobacillus neutriphilus TaxID=531815 RepID=A0ABQ2NSN9_9BACI|nr:MFS transporter [Oceanobacillus neutriphilus]GGP09054.1 MFS transporter [Oceanobacillus neutriphilus]